MLSIAQAMDTSVRGVKDIQSIQGKPLHKRALHKRGAIAVVEIMSLTSADFKRLSAGQIGHIAGVCHTSKQKPKTPCQPKKPCQPRNRPILVKFNSSRVVDSVLSNSTGLSTPEGSPVWGKRDLTKDERKQVSILQKERYHHTTDGRCQQKSHHVQEK